MYVLNTYIPVPACACSCYSGQNPVGIDLSEKYSIIIIIYVRYCYFKAPSLCARICARSMVWTYILTLARTHKWTRVSQNTCMYIHVICCYSYKYTRYTLKHVNSFVERGQSFPKILISEAWLLRHEFVHAHC